MKLSGKTIKDFQRIYQEEFGVNLDSEKADIIAFQLLKLVYESLEEGGTPSDRSPE